MKKLATLLTDLCPPMHTTIGYNLQSSPGTPQRAGVPVLFLHSPACQRLKKNKYGRLNFETHFLRGIVFSRFV